MHAFLASLPFPPVSPQAPCLRADATMRRSGLVPKAFGGRPPLPRAIGSRLEAAPTGLLLRQRGRRRRLGGLRRKAHPEHLASFADRKASRAFH